MIDKHMSDHVEDILVSESAWLCEYAAEQKGLSQADRNWSLLPHLFSAFIEVSR